ncbi:flagellar biosynthetic protein FlhB [Pseudorhodobacter antarcticus]|jgi:flagellar biosynthetic protein FlhB|uniref:Flagellar biosynthetic protein FlhB n=1 Tax=Pseudorhodobacter antarcticus TaxID=1077947 RepID=A0A1H8L1I8_9RHOB|nr:flagellar type III secretion system protein FlhB [Pseudorhodobacter antarcticus]SEN98987.1 flagellar biosynthetic protein FlhB [Pseudorhodobacter antarcticus]
MSEDQSPSEKEHEPSQKKLDDARKKGEIPRSADLITAASYVGFFIAGSLLGGAALLKAGEAAKVLLGQADQLSTQMLAGAGNMTAGILATFALALSAFFLGPFFAAALMVVGQRSMMFTSSKLAPKLNRISPLAGFKNKFGRKGLFEFGKSTAKLLLISILLFAFLRFEAEGILGLIFLSPALSTALLMEKIMRFLALVALIASVIGGIDYFWQRMEHMRSNRMSRKEMEDEHKNSEGDPHMKAKRRQRAQEIATNSMLSDVAKADVVIVNPTHYAVALRWDKSSGRAPVCVAKGVDEIAARIREKAAEAAIPLHSDPPTARLLCANLAIGQEVHPDQYRAVAAAIRFAESLRTKMRKKGYDRK